MNQKYELMIIVSSTITDEAIQKSLKEVKALLGSEVMFEELWGMRPFAYPIKNQDKGYYAVWNFMGTPEQVKEMEATLKLSNNIVRYLLIKVPENYTPISLAEVEAGLDALRKEKAEKRGKTKNAVQRRKEKEKETPEEENASEPKKEETSSPKEETKAPAKSEQASEEKGGKKSLDQKLEDILSDADLGL